MEKVMVQFSESNGGEIIDVRIYSKVPGSFNEWAATRRGISMKRVLLFELLKAMKFARKKWQKKART